MRLLAIESSTSLASCALWEDGRTIERRCESERNSSETLLPTVMTLLAEAGFPLAALDGIAFGAGPGSFTGLRVAAGLTQGLAFPYDLPVAPVETLAAVAWDSGASLAFATLDARMNEVYAATYRRLDGRLKRIDELRVAAPERLALPEPGDELLVCGNAVAVYPVLRERLSAYRLAAKAEGPRAGAIAELGAMIFAQGGGVPVEQAQPVYVRDRVAFTSAERLAMGARR